MLRHGRPDGAQGWKPVRKESAAYSDGADEVFPRSGSVTLPPAVGICSAAVAGFMSSDRRGTAHCEKLVGFPMAFLFLLLIFSAAYSKEKKAVFSLNGGSVERTQMRSYWRESSGGLRG